MQTSITRFHYNICLNLGLYQDENSSEYSWNCVIDVIRFRPIKTMETSIGPNEGNSSSKDESSVPSSIPSVRKFKETPIDGLDSRAKIFEFDTTATIKFWVNTYSFLSDFVVPAEWKTKWPWIKSTDGRSSNRGDNITAEIETTT